VACRLPIDQRGDFIKLCLTLNFAAKLKSFMTYRQMRHACLPKPAQARSNHRPHLTASTLKHLRTGLKMNSLFMSQQLF
jgi:hypothetical protein